jgi:hypothetical protein
MTHKQRLTHTSASKRNVKRFIGDPTLSNFIEELQIKGDAILLSVI